MADLKIVELNPDNLSTAIGVKVSEEQSRFVAPVINSIAEAYVNPTAWPRLILDGNEGVGFIMGNFDPGNEIEAFRAGIWRLNVSEHAQGRGVGRFAVEQLEAEARARGVDRITVLWEKGDGGPEEFYLKLGFVPTGEELFGEVVAAKVL